MGRHAAFADEDLHPEDQEAVELCRALFSEDRTSVKAFVSGFEIQTKDGRVLPNGIWTPMQPFKLNYAQEQLIDLMLQDWSDGHGASIVYDKGRQDGITTIVQFLLFERAHRGGPGYGVAISRKNEQNQVAFRMLNDFHRQVPKNMYELALGARVVTRTTSQFELEWGPTSRWGMGRTLIRCVTSKDASIGHGDANAWIAADEYAHWPQNKDALAEAWPSWSNRPGAFRFVFSTAKGKEQFQRLFIEAKSGATEWHAAFHPWLRNTRKTLRFKVPEDKSSFLRTVGKIPEFGQEDELNLVGMHRATPEQLHWRRVTIQGDCQGDIIKFKRLHPTTAEESFLTAESQFFNLVALEMQSGPGQEMDRAAKRGTLRLEHEVSMTSGGISNTAEAIWTEGQEGTWGPWRIYEMPEVGMSYAYGADPASGRAVQADGRHETDFATIEIRNILTKKIVAHYRGHTEPVAFAKEIVKGSLFYGKARGYVEANGPGDLVINEIAENMECGELLLTRRRLDHSNTSGTVWTNALGWMASAKTRNESAIYLKDWLLSLPRPRNEIDWAIPYTLIAEMERCQQDKSGRFIGSEIGHDDLVSASRICLVAIKVLAPQTDLWSAVRPRLPDHERAMLRMSELVVPSAAAGNFDADLGVGF